MFNCLKHWFFLSGAMVGLLFLLPLDAGAEVLDLSGLAVDYSAPFTHARLRGTLLVFTETQAQYDNPASSIPSRQTVITNTYIITHEDLQSLYAGLRKSGFLGLAKAYGAPEKERHYPYSIHVRFGRINKQVVFRSNPSFDSSPVGFRHLERQILGLIRTYAKKKD